MIAYLNREFGTGPKISISVPNSRKALGTRFVDSTDSKNKNNRSIRLCNSRTKYLSLVDIHFDVFEPAVGDQDKYH